MTEYTAKKVILKDANNNYLIPYTEKELPSQISNEGKILSTNGTNPTWITAPSGNNLFDFKWTDYSINDASWVRSDSFSWQDGTIYADAYNHLLADISSTTLTTETIGNVTISFYRATDGHKICLVDQESAVNNIYNSTGIAWYYILDTVNQQFKLPRTEYGFNGYRNKVGNYIAPGIPNPNIDIIYRQDSTSSGVNSDTYGSDGYTGASYSNTAGTDEWMQSSTDKGRNAPLGIVIKNAIYGASSTVQPPATQMYLYFYVGEFSQSATEQTAGLNTELINQKVDKSDLRDICPIIETYINGASGYFIRSDYNGKFYCEQWGQVSVGANTSSTVTLVKKMESTNYFATGTNYSYFDSGRYSTSPCIKKLSNTQIAVCNIEDTTVTYGWRVEGYLNSEEY